MIFHVVTFPLQNRLYVLLKVINLCSQCSTECWTFLPTSVWLTDTSWTCMCVCPHCGTRAADCTFLCCCKYWICIAVMWNEYKTRVGAFCHRKKVYLKIKLYPSYSSRTVKTKQNKCCHCVFLCSLLDHKGSDAGCWLTDSFRQGWDSKTKTDVCLCFYHGDIRCWDYRYDEELMLNTSSADDVMQQFLGKGGAWIIDNLTDGVWGLLTNCSILSSRLKWYFLWYLHTFIIFHDGICINWTASDRRHCSTLSCSYISLF